jgi:hypothetical protein
VVGRTLEEAFALENFDWCQGAERKSLGLRFRGATNLTVDEVVQKVHKRVTSSSFKKTNFALGLLEQDPRAWKVPRYIREGLEWLEKAVAPLPSTSEAKAEIVIEVGTADDTIGSEPSSMPVEEAEK